MREALWSKNFILLMGSNLLLFMALENAAADPSCICRGAGGQPNANWPDYAAYLHLRLFFPGLEQAMALSGWARKSCCFLE